MAEEISSERNVIAGTDRSHGPSWLEKRTFWALHLLVVVVCLFLVFGGGLSMVGGWFGKSWVVVDTQRAWLVCLVTILYFLRHGVTLFVLLMRKVTWSEALGLSAFLGVVEIGFCMLSAGVMRAHPAPLGGLDWFALFLVLFGSFLNTGSELQRKWWKSAQKNKGKCYTEGLFSYSMHINFFGDSLLFTGWSLLTGTWWTLAIPVMMTGMFIFMHIPGLDSYLEQRYGDEFKAYAKKTKKFIPFIY